MPEVLGQRRDPLLLAVEFHPLHAIANHIEVCNGLGMLQPRVLEEVDDDVIGVDKPAVKGGELVVSRLEKLDLGIGEVEELDVFIVDGAGVAEGVLVAGPEFAYELLVLRRGVGEEFALRGKVSFGW